MSQCVPNWEADLRHSPPPPAPLPSKTTVIGTTTSHPHSNSAPSLSMYDYDVAELTWENGQLALHGLGPPRINPNSPSCNNKQTWEKLHASGTLESIVNQAAHLQPIKSLSGSQNAWFDHHHHSTSTMDALVPSSNRTFSNNNDHNNSTVVPKLAGAKRAEEDEVFKLNTTSSLKRQRVVPVQQPVAQVGSSSTNNQSFSGGSTNSVRESWHVTVDTCDMEADVGMTCASTFGSLGNTISGKLSPSCTKPITISDHDSDNSQSRSDHQMKKGGRMEGDKNKGHSGKSSVSTRRSRAAAIHNQSERKRRDKINQKMKALQKLVPNSSKADKASMLDEVIEYIKQLQAQVDVMNKPMMMSNIPPNMMMPPPMTMQTMQQQLQMSAALMAQMGMGMGTMGMGTGGMLDLSQMGHHRNNIAGISPFFHPSATVMAADPAMSAFLACQQSQQQQQQQQQQQHMTMETYSRMAAALYQQLNHTQTLAHGIPNSKS